MITTIAWISVVVFSFLIIVLFFQEGKATGKETWFYTNKIWLLGISILIWIAGVAELISHTNH